MKVSLNWLKEFVDIDASADEIADKLTFSGTEVESIDRVGIDDTNVTAVRIESVRPHPDADRLVVCEVNTGTGKLEVVCGASNFKEGDVSILAGEGSVLPSGMKVESRKVRGVLSNGMLCAEDELGFSDDHSGIMILPGDIKPGTRFIDLAGPSDVIFSMEVTWNRSDCLSVLGIARELSALFQVPLNVPQIKPGEAVGNIEDLISVDIKDEVRCPRYSAAVLKNVKIRPSPLWMQRRLSSCGIRPINNIVDITNYVLLERGQPLHAFDYHLLKGNTIIVRTAKPGEMIRTLDGIEHKLDENMLVIADTERPVALAGVMGGEGTEIGDETIDILLESACFDAADIRSTSATSGIGTESSYRFERGIDIGAVTSASRRAVQLMVEYARAEPANGLIDIYPGRKDAGKVCCRFDRARSILGAEVTDDEMVEIFESLGLPVKSRNETECEVQIPTFRRDISIEADLIEEVIRLYGLDKIPVGDTRARLAPGADDSEWRAAQRTRDMLVGLGLREIVNYSTVSGQLLDRVCVGAVENRLLLPNPVSSDHALLRDSLLPQMMETLGRNHSRQVEDAGLFEMGRVFSFHNGSSVEDRHLCIGLMGSSDCYGRKIADEVDNEDSFLSVKGIVAELLRGLHVKNIEMRPENIGCMNPQACVGIFAGDKRYGFMGLMSGDVCRNWRITKPVAVAELAIEDLLKDVFRAPQIMPVPQYPAISRDMALVVDKSVLHGQIEKIIYENAPAELTSVKLFDIYIDADRIGSSRKSLAYSLSYRSSEKTLTDEDANRYHESIKSGLRRELEVEIREG